MRPGKQQGRGMHIPSLSQSITSYSWPGETRPIMAKGGQADRQVDTIGTFIHLDKTRPDGDTPVVTSYVPPLTLFTVAYSVEPGQGPDPSEVGLPNAGSTNRPHRTPVQGAFASFPANSPVSRETMPNTLNSGTRAGGKESMASEQSSQSHPPRAWPEAEEPPPTWAQDPLGTSSPRLPLPQDEPRADGSWQTSPGSTSPGNGWQQAAAPQGGNDARRRPTPRETATAGNRPPPAPLPPVTARSRPPHRRRQPGPPAGRR